MADAVIIIIILALVSVAVARIYRTVKYGGSCCSGGGPLERKIPVKGRNRENYPFNYRLKVEGMVCSGCVRKVENAFNSDEELWAEADLEHKEVRVLSKRVMGRTDFTELLKGTSYTLVDIL